MLTRHSRGRARYVNYKYGILMNFLHVTYLCHIIEFHAIYLTEWVCAQPFQGSPPSIDSPHMRHTQIWLHNEVRLTAVLPLLLVPGGRCA